MLRDIDRILLDRTAIARRVAEVAGEILRDHQRARGDAAVRETQITLVPVLTGSVIFVADLIRHLPLYMRIRMLSVSSYPGAVTTSQGPKLRWELGTLPDNLAGEHVLVIDDILDSGDTLRVVTAELTRRQPATLRTCVLLKKNRPRAVEVPVDYVCFEIPDQFVVGYGLDYDGYYRNLPDIVTLRPEAIAPADSSPGTLGTDTSGVPGGERGVNHHG